MNNPVDSPPWDTGEPEAVLPSAPPETEALAAIMDRELSGVPGEAEAESEPAPEEAPPVVQRFAFAWLTTGAADGMPTFEGVHPTPLQLFALAAWLHDMAAGMLEQNRAIAFNQAMAQQQDLQAVAREVMGRRR